MIGATKFMSDWSQVGMVTFRLLDTSGTPSIDEVFPTAAAGDISVADTAQGRATITIKNFKGPQGKAKIFVTPQTTSLMAAVVKATISYSNDDLSFEVSVEDDASALTDASNSILAIAY